MNVIKYEIDMLNVKAADAILIRCFNEKNWEYIILIDAGNKSDGEIIKKHIKKYYKQNYIDLAICTHPDNDHIGGFDYLLDNIKIDEFWIHDPSKHISLSDVRNKISEASLTKSLKYITETLDNNVNIIDKIDRLEITRKEPFNGLKHHSLPIYVLGPSIEYYEELLKFFKAVDLLFEQEAIFEKRLLDDISITALSETLDEEDDKSAENNSSAVFLFYPNDKKYLFAGDAGPLSLNKIIEKYSSYTQNLHWLKVPHHGSKKSLSSDLISHFSPKVSYISGNGKGKYPSQAVVNVLKKVGSDVYSTHKGGSKWHQVNSSPRDDYSTAIKL